MSGDVIAKVQEVLTELQWGGVCALKELEAQGLLNER